MGNFMGMCLSNLCLFQRLYDVSSKKYQIEKLPQKKGEESGALLIKYPFLPVFTNVCL